MKRLARWLFHLASALSLLLCIAAVLLMVGGDRTWVLGGGGSGVVARVLSVRRGVISIGDTISGVWFEGSVHFPLWLLVLAMAALPAWWAVRRSAERRQAAAGLCRHCGYDLRATPDRCPECGTSVTPEAR